MPVLVCAARVGIRVFRANNLRCSRDSSDLFMVLFTRFSLWSHGCARARTVRAVHIFRAPAFDIGSRNEPILVRCRFEIRKMQTRSLERSKRRLASPGEDVTTTTKKKKKQNK